MAYASDIRLARKSLRDWFDAARKSFAEARRQREIYKRTINELNMLNERELADLGISAAQIETIAREAAYGRK
ncbi:MAG: DUF1127 domain-containing protein [Alphaproteobacteria bacterium]|nr:MAG: DUF1127 domain-containing protein [Alphaproteobacteria bacterium]